MVTMIKMTGGKNQGILHKERFLQMPSSIYKFRRTDNNPYGDEGRQMWWQKSEESRNKIEEFVSAKHLWRQTLAKELMLRVSRSFVDDWHHSYQVEKKILVRLKHKASNSKRDLHIANTEPIFPRQSSCRKLTYFLDIYDSGP